jgi:ABC-type transport system involved in cytochrome bd biosynthesis fused ATPase/permease subunit
VHTTALGHAHVDGHDVLDAVDLDIAPRRRVALVGASGAGKTTPAELVAGVHSPTRGVVRIGGAALHEQGPAVVRQTVALITQEVHVFAGPLADDLRLAKPDATTDELLGALAAVHALGWAKAARRRTRHARQAGRRRRALRAAVGGLVGQPLTVIARRLRGAGRRAGRPSWCCRWR